MNSESQAILKMTGAFEGVDATTGQSEASVGSVTPPVNPFAITAEFLDDCLDKLRQEWKEDLKVHKSDTIRRLDGLNKRLDDVANLQITMQALLEYFVTLILAVLSGLVDILRILLVPSSTE